MGNPILGIKGIMGNPILGIIGASLLVVAVLAVLVAMNRFSRVSRRIRGDATDIMGSDAWITYQQLQNELKNPKAEETQTPETADRNNSTGTM